MPSVKVMDIVDAISAAPNLPPEVDINQVGETDKVSNSRSYKYLTEFILDVIKVPEGVNQGIPTPQKLASW